jgi:hypothetical protein
MPDRPLDILYVGQLTPGGTCLQRMNAIRDLGHRVASIDLKPPHVARAESRIWRRARRKLLGIGPTDISGINDGILAALRQRPFDVLWLDKALAVRRRTLDEARRISPRTRIVGYSPDDMNSWPCQSRDFLQHLPAYDIFFTTKTFGVAELRALGCPRVSFVGNAFDPAIHHPVPVTDEDRAALGGPVGFIGDYERERSDSLLMLAANGIPVRIWGPNWDRFGPSHPNLRIEGKSVWSRDYAKAICAFDINLGFLRKVSRDLQTTRSIEIPACGGFMLAERTGEHLDLFVEGKEAAFFETPRELLEKVRHYLDHPEERMSIAKAGRERCLTGGYSNHDRLAKMIETVNGLPA